MGMAGGLRKRRLTVVDDSPELLALFGDMLRFDGVDIALMDASATLEDIEQSAPDLVVMDLRLGAENLAGLDMIRRLRSQRKLQVPIIVCSAALDAISDHDQELSETSDLFVLRKPFSLEQLESCLHEALGTAEMAPTGT